ncbi:hypothetical protein HG530_013202 [Fusarium avenaceum]|nr:hypothetical protein HG530_013202 [Fusarium avenaceum]
MKQQTNNLTRNSRDLKGRLPQCRKRHESSNETLVVPLHHDREEEQQRPEDGFGELLAAAQNRHVLLIVQRATDLLARVVGAVGPTREP